MNRVHAQVEAFNLLRDGMALAASVIGPLVLYVLTMPRTVVLEDDGLFLMAGAHLGVAHPPGYPLYTLIVYLFTQLPFGSIAFLGHLSSAVLGALTCGCVYVCARLLGASPIPALTATWLFAASEHFWSQAIITEVYTLNALFFFLLYALLLYGIRHPHRTGIWIVAAVAYGLSLANHWPLMVLSTPGLMLLVFPVWRTVYRKLPLLLGVSLPSAVLPYAWMVWRSHQDLLISFYGSIDTLKEFWYYFSRQGYAHIDASPSAGWSDRFGFMQWLGNEFLWQLTLPGFALAVFGLIVLFRRQIAQAGSGLLVFLGNSIVLIALLGFDFDFYGVAVFRPYSLLCYGIAALWLGIGLQAVLDWLAERLSSKFVRGPGFKVGIAVLMGAAMVAWSVHEHWRANDRADSDFAEHYAGMLLDPLPENAILFVSGDSDSFPIGYYQYIENRRPDVALYSFQGLVYGKRLYDHLLPTEKKTEILEHFIDSTDRAVFFVFIAPDFFPDNCGKRIYGFLMEAVKNSEPGTIELKRHSPGEQYFAQLTTQQPVDRWERCDRNRLLFRYGQYLGLIYFSGNPILLHSMQDLFRLVERNYTCLLGMASILLDNGNSSHWKQVSAWLDRAETLKREALDKEFLAKLYYLKGSLLEKQGQRVAAVASFGKSRDIYPHPDNKALEALEQYKINFKRVNPR